MQANSYGYVKIFLYLLSFVSDVMDGKYFPQFNYGSNWLPTPKNHPGITLLFPIFTLATSFRDVTKSMKTYKGFIKKYVIYFYSC